jgi:hypothetical protein
VDEILREADHIAQGEDPSAAARESDSAPGQDGGDGTRAPSPSSPPIAEADRKLARRVVALTDKAFTRFFGPGSQFEPFEQDIAVEDWAEVIAHYAPKFLTGSPGWRLAGLYVAHLAVCALGSEWMHEPPMQPNEGSPATSAAADPAKQP